MESSIDHQFGSICLAISFMFLQHVCRIMEHARFFVSIFGDLLANIYFRISSHDVICRDAEKEIRGLRGKMHAKTTSERSKRVLKGSQR